MKWSQLAYESRGGSPSPNAMVTKANALGTTRSTFDIFRGVLCLMDGELGSGGVSV